MRPLLLCAALSLGLCVLAHAQEEPLENGKPLEDTTGEAEITGLVIDRTITRMGRQFYDFFAAYWRANYPDSEATLSIHERPSARWGSQIWVEYRRTEYAKQFVGPTRANQPELPEAVARYMHQEIQKQLILEQFIDTFDMEKSEL